MFDSNFLTARAKKQKRWAKKGIKSGSGKPFADLALSAPTVDPKDKALSRSKLLNDEPFAGGSALLAGGEAVIGDGAPSWLMELVKTDVEIKKGLVMKGYEFQSPHARALCALAKDPTGLKGKEEHFIQVRLFRFVEREYPQYYDDFFAIPNGGLRSASTAKGLREEGQKAGIPDTFIDVAKGAYHGMRLEVKADKGRLQPNQVIALQKLSERGYFAVMGRGYHECESQIISYLNLPDFDAKTRINP